MRLGVDLITPLQLSAITEGIVSVENVNAGKGKDKILLKKIVFHPFGVVLDKRLSAKLLKVNVLFCPFKSLAFRCQF